MALRSRATRQKRLLAACVEEQEGFFSARDVAQQVPAVGTATIYRFLVAAARRGALHTYRCGGRRIYSRERRSHCHFTCTRCGAVQHIDLKSLDLPTGAVDGQVCHVQLDLTGRCSTCSEKHK